MMKSWVARFYDQILAGMEETYFVPIRKELLTGASGRCLEIGAGTGASMGAWPVGITELVLLEPCPQMRIQLLEKIKVATDAGTTSFPVRPKVYDAAVKGMSSLPFEDNSFDTILLSLLLCGVESQEESCKEIRRVLKAGGKVMFVEHVQAREGTWVRTLTPYLQPLWGWFWSCSILRDTKSQLQEVFDDMECKEVVAPFTMTYTVDLRVVS